MVNKYFERIGKVISGFQEMIIDPAIRKKNNDKQGLISGEIEFTDESELLFMELKNTEQDRKKKYRYHYMDNIKELIFRYDNAKHHPEIDTFPHHKHTAEKVEESIEPELIDVLSEIQERIKNSNNLAI